MKKLYIIVIALFTLNIANAQWQQTNGLSGENIKNNCLASSGTNIFAGTDASGVYLSTNFGSSWADVNNGLTDHDIFSLAINDINIFAGTWMAGVFLSTNNGASWTPINVSSPPKTTMAFAFHDTNIFAGSYGGGVFLSTDNGSSWTAVNNGLTDLFINALAVNGTYIFAGTPDGVFISTNNGALWTAVNNNGLANTMSFAFHDANIFAGTWGGGVFLSTNNGSSWTAVNNGLSDPDVQSLVMSGSTLFAGTLGGGGVFLSTNNGSSWTLVNSGLTNTYVHTLLISGNYIFAGTTGWVWKRLLSEMSGIEEINENKGLIVFPNPAINDITIEKPNTKEQSYIVSIKNIQEQEVLSDKVNFTGKHSINVSGLCNGIYIITLQNEKEIYVSKIIIQK